MTQPRQWIRRVTQLVGRRTWERDLADEMALHVELRAAKHAHDGLSPQQASRRARLQFGGALQLREESRDAWGWRWIEDVVRDVRSAVVGLRRAPVFAALAIVSLTLGFALTSLAAAVVQAYLVRPLPYPAADRVFHVMYAPPGPWEPRGLSALDWSTLQDIVEFPLISNGETFHVADRPGPALRARRVNYGMLAGLELPMVAGRTLSEADFLPGAEPAALIGFSAWRDRFGADLNALNRPVTLDTPAGRAERVRIVGVLPRDFHIGGDSLRPIDLIVAVTAPPRTYYLLRLRPDVAPALVEQRLTAAVRGVSTDLPTEWTGVHLEAAHDRYIGTLRPALVGVASAAAFVLLIAVANVAVLIVLRAAHRQRELAMRLALGATRGRLAMRLAAECGAITGSALMLGLAGAYASVRVVAPWIEAELGRPAPSGAATIALDPAVIAYAAATAAGITALLVLASVAMLRRRPLEEAARQSRAEIGASPSMNVVRSGMLAVEVVVTLVLLVGCGLMVNSLRAMQQVDLGFDPAQLSRARIELRADEYADPTGFAGFFEAFTTAASARLGAPVVFSSWPVFVPFPEQAIEIEDRDGAVLMAGAVTVGPHYFSTMKIQMRRGRDLTWDDVRAADPPAVISQALAERLWPGTDALGRRLRRIEITAGGARPPGPWQTVVGVAWDVRQTYADTNLNDIYTPGVPQGRFGSFFVRASSPPSVVLSGLAEVARSIAPRATLDLFHAVDEDNRERAGTVFLSVLLASFASVAALIAIVGVYAVHAYAVTQRQREVAIRVALGGSAVSVSRLFVTRGARVIAGGLAAGVMAATVVTRLLEHHVFGVVTFGPGTIAATTAVLAVACVLAMWWPAHRVARRTPLVMLRDG